ncbi:MAG: MGMT family protein [Spirochaetaceae bacterium]
MRVGGPSLEERAAEAISRIPESRVSTYGAIAALAGNPRAARSATVRLAVNGALATSPYHSVLRLTPLGAPRIIPRRCQRSLFSVVVSSPG